MKINQFLMFAGESNQVLMICQFAETAYQHCTAFKAEATTSFFTGPECRLAPSGNWLERRLAWATNETKPLVKVLFLPRIVPQYHRHQSQFVTRGHVFALQADLDIWLPLISAISKTQTTKVECTFNLSGWGGGGVVEYQNTRN